MSTIEELRIQGIRSFGGKSEDMQLVEFSSPVTLILGENGCGKTTIIECLKYALTGEAPPGSSRGQNFVHDPNIFGFSESLGQIKLRVKNIRGEEQTVSRCMKLHYKRGKLTFETMDSTISYGDESISKRCIDVDLAMCQFMGVSKAIINNVIFCHQEDSSWPLDEAKKLKEKFDAIFGITEYNKAIEKFMVMRKDQMSELKKKEITLKHLNYLKKEMENKTMDLQVAYNKYESIQNQCATFDEDMKPINKRLDEIRKVEFEVGKQQSLKVAVETKKKTSSERISKLKTMIKRPFEGTIQQLDREIRNFREKISEKRMKKDELDETLSSLQKQEKKIQLTISELEKKFCVLLQQRQREQESNAERAEKMHKLCDKLSINIDHINLEESSEEVPVVLQNISKSLQLEEKNIKDQQAAHEKADHKKQKLIDELRETKARVENDIESKQKQRKQIEIDLQKTEKEINNIETSALLLKKLTEKINRITEVYEETSKTMNQEGMKSQIAEKKANVTRLEEQFKSLDVQLTFLNSISKLMAGINLKEEELERKEQEMRRIKAKHHENLKKVLDRPIETNYKISVQTISDRLQRQVKELSEKINNLKLKEQSHEIKRKTKKDELTRWEKELGEKKDIIYEKCRSTPYEELVAKSREQISKYQLDHGALKSSEAMYKRYIKNIEEEPSCPLCHNSMGESDATTLTVELTEKIQRLPENINRSEKLLKAEQKKYESLIQLHRVIEEVEHLERDIPIRKMELKELETKISEITSEVESCQMLQIEPSASVELANSMLGDMSVLDEAMKEAKRLSADLKELKKKLPENSSTASIDDVQLEKTTVGAELENERKVLEKKQADYERGNEILNELREERNKMKDKQIQLQEGVQSIPQLKERKADLNTQLDAIAKEIATLREDLQPLKDKLLDLVTEKQISKESNRKIISEMQAKLETFKILNQDIQRLNRELIAFDQLNLCEEIECVKISTQRHKSELTQKTNQINKTTQELEKVKDDILNQDVEERDLKDNRDLKELEEEATKLDAEILELSKMLCDLDFRRVSKEKEELITKHDKLVVSKSELLGQMGEINNQINKLKGEIDEPEFKNSIQNYRKSFYEVEIAKRTIADLGQYRLALEYALIKFHSEKMEKINRLIREYWRQIYRGNDIDYIQIQTDEMKADASADKRRSYNYRVIQSKNNSEIEMRGRCSAGQRVLASLIIRMALAETFSCNCGVLALDEPTTNLDRTNIRSLCEALNRIVDERQTQHNFMLIIITHDEEFISTLGRIDLYHHVLRNDDGKSMIRKVRIR